jgi:predicted TIM-barrel fold metal-dependent hydrolase
VSGIIDFRIGVPYRATSSDPPVEITGKLARYDDLYSVADSFNWTMDDLLAEMESAGVERAVLHAEYAHGEPAVWNRKAAEAVARYPDRFVGIGTVDPADSRSAVSEAKRCFEEYGFLGINLQPCVSGVPANDRRSYLVYAVVLDHGGIVTTHTGINFFAQSPIRLGHPLDVCDVACDLPDLKIVACHGGWPWADELAAVAWKHPNVYVDFGAISPKYLLRGDTGYGVAWNLANGQFADRLLFGTDWPTISLTRVVGELADRGLTPESHPGFFAGNTARLLGLDLGDGSSDGDGGGDGGS